MAQGAAPLAEGEILAGKYRVLFAIGEGGMGQVFAAEHVQLGHKVALKVLRPSALESEEAVERFLREGRAAARLQSEHVARVSDVGKLDSGVPYMVMEFLEGRDLAQLLGEQGKLPIDQAVGFIIQAGEAIAEAHHHGIVHRDLKPANLFVTTALDGAPLVKVLDFGISKASSLLGAASPQITTTSAIIGSPKYMSPEQMQDSRAVDGRADIWALGSILYEMLAGRLAFDAPTLATTCVQILQATPPRVRQSREEVPPGLDEVVMRCLEKNPDERFASVAELVQALSPFAPESGTLVARINRMKASRSVEAPPPSRRGRPAATEVASSEPPVVSERPGKRAGVVWGAAVALVIVIGVVAVVRLRVDGDPAVSPASAAPAAILPATPPVDVPAPTAAESSGAESSSASIPVASPTASPAAASSLAAPPAVPIAPRRPPFRPRPAMNPTGVTDSVLEDRR
ncbi:MAG TPA: serine/threonine-protein kinase [Polyangiaceae bacterium]